MDLVDTPCPPISRRKRLRPTSPEPDFTLPLPENDAFTTELPTQRLTRRPANSLAVAPKRRRIPLNLVQKVTADRKQDAKPALQANVPKTEDLPQSNRRMSTRSQTASLIFPSSPAVQPDSSALHADVSCVDSTLATILSHSSPNVSNISVLSAISKQEPQNPPPKKRRRISELVRRVAAAAVSKATSTKAQNATTKANAPKPKTATAPMKSVKKDAPKNDAPKKKSAAIAPKARPSITNLNRRTSTASTTSVVITNPRPALKQVSRGMNLPARPSTGNRASSPKKPKPAAGSGINRLRLQKTKTQKSFSDTEFTKSKVTKSTQKKPARKSASAYPSLVSSSSTISNYSLNPTLHSSTSVWLSNQETLLESILNEILLSGTANSAKPEFEIRRDLLDLYSTNSYVLLHERLKASVLHGVLKPSEDQMSDDSGIGLAGDLGERDKFTKLFTESYNPSVLKVGMEVITGRSMGGSATEIPKFFDTFFVDIEDDTSGWETYGANQHGNLRVWVENEQVGSKGWRLRRTILRSLLLIHILDSGKQQGVFAERLLFRKESAIKSSNEMLEKVCKVLLPAIGSGVRILKGCKYTVEVVQKGDEEYNWGIKNLKVDLRDGVRLAKAAEILGISADEKKLVAGLSLMPKSRGEKAANVEKVLKVFYAKGVLPEGSIRAKDIVDGHREVTLSVLWAVAGGVGVKSLIDWKELEGETRRLVVRYKLDDSEFETTQEGEKGYLAKLENWVKAIMVGRKNQHTEFNVGDIMKEEVVGAVLVEYEALIGSPLPASKMKNTPTIKERLKNIGCSEAFLALFAPTEEKDRKVVNEQFVVSALSFLASRVLSSTRRNRAAARIQRWWRHTSFKRNIFGKMRGLVEEARELEELVQKRRELWATRIIQRAWRRAVEQRIADLVQRITSVQALARGVLIRNKWDYSFKAGKKPVRKEIAVPKKESGDPYKLRDDLVAVEDGLERKDSKRGRRRKAKVVDNMDGAGDIWQDLAGLDE